MYYLKKFAQHSEYESYITGNTALLPNVSICGDEPGTVHFKPAKIYEYVDLGLPSGKKWAKCNIGAEKETDYGDYFMWGSTTPDTDNVCNWANAPFNGGTSSFNETYFASVSGTVCPNGVLALEYDAARQIMGGDWRMPTKEDYNELLTFTTNVWVEDYNGSGVNGRLFTSKTNGKTLFFPAAGYRYGSSFLDQGDDGGVWSSLLNTGSPFDAWELYFDSDDCYMDGGNRYYGFSVRGIL